MGTTDFSIKNDDAQKFGTWVDAEHQEPPMKDSLFGMHQSELVLVTDGKMRWLGYLQNWDKEEYPSEWKTWKMSGPDGYNIEGVTHWMPLPHLPVTKVEREPEGLEGIENCVDCGWPTRYWLGGHTPLCSDCADKRNQRNRYNETNG